MSYPTREYWSLLEADRRYANRHEEVLLRTLCGCERVSASDGNDIIRTTILVSPMPRYSENFDPAAEVVYRCRYFRNSGLRDEQGRLIYLEEPDSTEKELERLRCIEAKYKQLWDSVYGMDKGL